MKIKNYYEVLDVSPHATAIEIKKAYFVMVRRYHPDKHPDEFMEIREAYEALSNEETRQEYDEIASMPKAARSVFEQARLSLLEGETESAIALFEEVTIRFNNISLVMGLLGEAYLKNGNSGKALNIFEDLVVKHPSNAGFKRNLAHAYLERGWYKKALSAYRDAIELDEDNLSLWMGIASAYTKASDFLKAKETVLEALERGKDKDWDKVALYFRLLEYDVKLSELDDMENHLDILARMAIQQKDIREAVGWSLGELAKIMVHQGINDAAFAMIQKVNQIIPDEDYFLSLEEQFKQFIKLEHELKSLTDDESISGDLTNLILFYIHPYMRLEDTIYHEAVVYIHEHQIIMNIQDHYQELRQFRKKYPGLYAINADFFDALLDRDRRRNLARQYNKKALKYADVVNDMMHSFMEDEDCDDDIDLMDFEEEDYFEPQQPYVREQPKTGRNDPCPCGSGKKYKKCCGVG